MHLLQPLSGSEIKLPHQKSIYKYKEHLTLPPYTFTCKAALSANPSESLDFVLMITHGSGGMFIGYWRPGDKAWTSIEFDKLAFKDLITYQDCFYLITGSCSIWSCKVSKNEHIVCRVSEPSRKILYEPKLVESAGALLVFDRMLIRIMDVPPKELKLYEINLIEGVWKRILSLGDRAIFVGNNTTFCLDKAYEFPGIESNHIYCTDDLSEEYTLPSHEREQDFGQERKGGQEMGHYCLEDAKVTPFDIEESLSDVCPPFWFLPSF